MHAWTQHPTGTQWRNGQHWRCLTWSLAAVLALILGAPSRTHAKTFRCRAGDADCLIDAINTANANGQKNTIRLGAGTYTLTKAVDGTGDDTNGLPVITSTITIVGARAAPTIIARDTSVSEHFRLLKVAATGTLTLKGLTLQGGSSPISGGGIYNAGGTVTLTHCSLADNTGFGGLFNNAGTMTLTHCSLTHNGGFDTGGIRNQAGGLVILTHSTVANNNGHFGGLQNIAGVVIMTSTTFSGNTGDGVGGLANKEGSYSL